MSEAYTKADFDDVHHWMEVYRARLQEANQNIDRLRNALAPFAKLAEGIPENWPRQCKLRVDNRRDGTEYNCYHEEPEAHLGILPTIGEWFKAAEIRKQINPNPMPATNG